MLPLYERIDKLCKDNGTNITQMCKDAGVPRSALSEYKAGRNKTISFSNLQKIADYFKMTVDELVNGETAETKKDEITFDDFTYAMYGHSKDLTEEQKQLLLKLAEDMRGRRGL